MKKQLLIGTLVSLIVANTAFAAGTCNTEEAVKAADKKWLCMILQKWQICINMTLFY